MASASKPVVRTVLGDIAPGQLGRCYAHEHIIIERSYATQMEPDFCLDSVELAARELRDFHSAGGRAMVDTMPCDCGRSIEKLVEVSRQSGVHIICPTGLHLQKYYPAGHWSERIGVDELADLFVAEIEEGIDANDCGGPVVKRTAHRAGVIKVAGGKDKLSAVERRNFEAAALAHRRTGCPIITHTEQGTAGIEQIDIFSQHRVDLERVTLSHTDRKPDFDYHRSLLRMGVKLEYDSAFRWKEKDGNPTLELVLKLLPEFPRQIMLGMDAARQKYWKSYGGSPGLTFLLESFAAQLRQRGLPLELLDNVFITNPAEAFSFAWTEMESIP